MHQQTGIMQLQRQALIDELIQITERSTKSVQGLKQLSDNQLNFKEHSEQWSALECIEHLNLYGDYYLPEIEKSIFTQNKDEHATIFKSGLLGNYFANLMKVNNGKVKKMRSPKDKNPVHSQLTSTTIDRFLKQQEMLKQLLEKARHTNLTMARTPISISKMVRLRLGDTFRFFVYHLERHVLQAEKAAAKAPLPNS